MWECSGCGVVVESNLRECLVCGKQKGKEDRVDTELDNKRRLSFPLIVFNVLYGSIIYPIWIISSILLNGFFGSSPTISEKAMGILMWVLYLGIWALVNRIIIKKKHQGDLLYLLIALALLVVPSLIMVTGNG